MTNLSPEQVSSFLKQNPSFLQQHPDLFEALESDTNLPPFHQRQLEVLRERHSAEQAKYEMVVDSARNNQALEHTLHLFAQRLLADHSNDRANRMAELETAINQQFDLEQNRIFIAADCEAQNSDGNLDYSLIAPRVAHGGSICDDRVSGEQKQRMFGDDNAIQSCAFVPLPGSDDSIMGVMVLGSNDDERFQPGMGAIYLDRIGELIAAFLRGGGEK